MGTSSDDVRPISMLLNELSSTELNDRIVSLPSFQCIKCEKLLLPPIRLIEGLGNICGKCEVESMAIVLHNHALEVVLQNLLIPCPNRSQGCKKHFNYLAVSKHLEMCTKHSCSCPYNALKDCKWEGSSSSVARHCFEKHSENRLQGNDNSFYIRVDIKSTNDLVKLFNVDHDTFVVHVKCDLHQSSALYVVLYCMGNPTKIEDFLLTIDQTQVTNYSLQCKINKILPYNAGLTLDVDKENSTKINLSSLEQFLSPSVFEVVLKITPKNDVEVVNESFLTIFECLVCNNYMKPPIFQCLTGHSLCTACRPKLGHCPTCRAGFSNTRNYSLEVLSHKMMFPCLYKELGCRVVMTGSEITNHEDECSAKPYNCPFFDVNKCPWEGSLSGIQDHILRQHSTKVRSLTTSLLIPMDGSSDIHCLLYNDDTFRVCHKYSNHNGYWAVQYVGPKYNAKNYKYEIILTDGNNENKKLIKSDECQELTSYNKMFTQCITIPSNMMFSSRNGMTYVCKISKIENFKSNLQ